MALRIGLFVGGLFVFVFLGIGAVSAWVEVFAAGPASTIPTTGISGRDSESPAIVGALVSTFFALVGAFAAAVAVWDHLRHRRRRAAAAVKEDTRG